MGQVTLKVYATLDRKIREMERLAQEVRDLGVGLPVVEMNSRSVLCSVEALRCGISDLVGVLNEQPRGKLRGIKPKKS